MDWLWKTSKEYTVNTYAAQYALNTARSVVQPYIPQEYEASKVHTNVFVGNFGSASNLKMLELNKIKNIVVAAYGLWEMFPKKFNYKRVDVVDSEYDSLSPHFEEISKFIYEAAVVRNENVLIHCVAGVSRSAAIVIAYLILQHGMHFDEAVHQVKQWRPQINPNDKFCRELRTLKPKHYLGKVPSEDDFTSL
jgi:protein tyrosine phosphatase